jgi:hypothetical protein
MYSILAVQAAASLRRPVRALVELALQLTLACSRANLRALSRGACDVRGSRLSYLTGRVRL